MRSHVSFPGTYRDAYSEQFVFVDVSLGSTEAHIADLERSVPAPERWVYHLVSETSREKL